MATAVEWAAFSLIGRSHTRNQDRFGADGTLFCLADGMGGPPGGHDAATVAMRSVMRSRPDGAAALAGAFTTAATAVRGAGRGRPRGSDMGTTLTAVLVTGDGLLVAAIGDTRCHLVGADGLRQVTVDDTVATALEVTPDDPRYPQATATLTRRLGSDDDADVEVTLHLVDYPMVVVLTTDGVHEVVAADDLIPAPNTSPDLHALYVVGRADRAGTADDATVVVIAVEP